MPDSLFAWIALAVLLFWAIGAYNRLVRLRAEVKSAFAQVDAQFQQELNLVRSLLPPDEAGPDSLFPGEGLPSFWDSLEGAATQLGATLAMARARPLDGERIDALAAAGNVLEMAWERAEREDAHDLAGPRLPEAVAVSRTEGRGPARAAVGQFNEAVSRYNAAIAQFPALLLAWVFAFQPARSL